MHHNTMILLSIFMLVCPLFARGGDAVSGPEVSLTSGKFVGISSTANGTDKWLGIPFAQPPLGNLRFKAPVAITKPSQEVVQATTFGDACPQEPSTSLGAPLSEDCLTLNVCLSLCDPLFVNKVIPRQVWRPIGTTSEDKLPVMVWFYVSTIRMWS